MIRFRWLSEGVPRPVTALRYEHRQPVPKELNAQETAQRGEGVFAGFGIDIRSPKGHNYRDNTQTDLSVPKTHLV